MPLSPQRRCAAAEVSGTFYSRTQSARGFPERHGPPPKRRGHASAKREPRDRRQAISPTTARGPRARCARGPHARSASADLASNKKTRLGAQSAPSRVWCPGGESNPHSLSGNMDLNHARLPIPPPRQWGGEDRERPGRGQRRSEALQRSSREPSAAESAEFHHGRLDLGRDLSLTVEIDVVIRLPIEPIGTRSKARS